MIKSGFVRYVGIMNINKALQTINDWCLWYAPADVKEALRGEDKKFTRRKLKKLSRALHTLKEKGMFVV